MLINFRISLKPKRLFLSFYCHSDKTVTLSELLRNINNSVIKYWIFSESFTKVASKLSSYCNARLDPLIF